MLSMIAGIGSFLCECDSRAEAETEFYKAHRLLTWTDRLKSLISFSHGRSKRKSPTSLSGKWGLFSLGILFMTAVGDSPGPDGNWSDHSQGFRKNQEFSMKES
jgi:hypothetical protein